MNPTQTRNSNKPNLFEGIENWNEFEKAEPEIILVSHSEQDRQQIRESFISLYNRKTENITEVSHKSPENRMETSNATVSAELSDKNFTEENTPVLDLKPIFAIENAKGDDSSLREAWVNIDLAEKLKGLAKNLFGGLSVFGELFIDAVNFFVPKDKKAEPVEADPAKAKAKAEKKLADQKKKNNIRAFYDGLQAQNRNNAPIEAVRMETQEKANINLTAKIGQESYKGIKDSFGRITIYAASMFERAQLDQEKQIKKQEKEMKIAAVKGGPDLNMDKVAEGGFLSSTGGQGAG